MSATNFDISVVLDGLTVGGCYGVAEKPADLVAALRDLADEFERVGALPRAAEASS